MNKPEEWIVDLASHRPGIQTPPADLDVTPDHAPGPPPEVKPDHSDGGDDFFPTPTPQPRHLAPPITALLSVSGHVLIILALGLWSASEANLSGFEGAPEMDIQMVSLLGGGPDLAGDSEEAPEEMETPPEPEPMPEPEPAPPPELELPPKPEPEALKVAAPPKPKPKPKPAPKPKKKKITSAPTEMKSATAPPGPGSPDGQSSTGGGGSGVKGGPGSWRATSVPKPAYPAEAKANGWQGTVLVKVLVQPSGSISAVELARSSGYPSLDGAALSAARRIKFRLTGTRPSGAVSIRVPYRFNLRD